MSWAHTSISSSRHKAMMSFERLRAKQLKLYVHDFDEVMPWKDWSKRAAKVDAYLSERAKETLDDGQPRFGEFHRYLERDETTS